MPTFFSTTQIKILKGYDQAHDASDAATAFPPAKALADFGSLTSVVVSGSEAYEQVGALVTCNADKTAAM